ncbi:unnamed protein product, partial [Ectocarpus fasciculatus]
ASSPVCHRVRWARMGITGLLPFLKSVTYPTHISEYRGLKAGVDAYCWLHRGAFSCGMELCTGVATDKYVAFCMKRVNLLLHHGIQPVMVFDGASLPIKRSINLERRRQRESARSKGEAALAAGEAGAAAQHFSKAVGVTHDMAFHFMKALRQAGVELIVAPYEADAQLAFLSRSGAVDVVLSEDSDCLPYGCKKVLFKMDNEGHGQEIQLRNLAANTPLSLSNWKNSMFLDLCLLVGCDYISTSVKGLGIATAYKLVDRHRSLDKIMGAINSSRFVIPEGYWDQYKRARLTFRHHIIYNPQSEETFWPFAPHSRDEKGDIADGKAMGWQQGPGMGLGLQNRAGEGWGQRLSAENDETADARHDGHKSEGYPAVEELAHRKPDSLETNQNHAREADVRQGLLALTGELPVADQAKYVPASAQHFQSTQVSQGLETLQRRKRRLYPAGDPECLGLPNRGQQHQIQPGAADSLQGSNLPVFGARVDSSTCESGVDLPADSNGLWMVQPQEARGISSVNPPAPVSSPGRLRAGSRVGTPVLTASSRRWTLPVPSTAPPVNREGFPLLRLLDGKGKVAPERSWSVDGRIGGARVGQPSPKRTRGVEFWDNLLG